MRGAATYTTESWTLTDALNQEDVAMTERPQSQKHFDQAKLILDSDATDALLSSNAFDGNTPDGIFQILVEHGTTPVKLQTTACQQPNKGCRLLER